MAHVPILSKRLCKRCGGCQRTARGDCLACKRKRATLWAATKRASLTPAERCEYLRYKRENERLRRLSNPEHLKAAARLKYERHQLEIRTAAKSPEKRAHAAAYVRIRRATDAEFKLILNLRQRVNRALRAHGAGREASTRELIGCSSAELRRHLEARFDKGMNWYNYGWWHVDHIIPCASFDLTKPEEQKKCFNVSNLQPLWAHENHRKHARKDWR